MCGWITFTDIILIIFWFAFDLVFYAILQIVFIILTQLVTAIYINDIYVKNDNGSRKHEKYFMRFLLSLGLGRVYYSVIPWNNDETLKARYQMCKVWEMLFESMPSVALSTYATLVININSNNDDSFNFTYNTSVLLSMLFSYINITNTIVNLLDSDKMVNDRDEQIAKVAIDKNNNHTNDNDNDCIKSVSIMSPTMEFELKVNEDQNTSSNDTNLDNSNDIELVSIVTDRTIEKNVIKKNVTSDNDSNVDINTSGDNNNKEQQTTNILNGKNSNAIDTSMNNDNDNKVNESSYWILVDKSTNDVKFFKEEMYVPKETQIQSNNNQFTQYSNKAIAGLFRFNIKMKNFTVWIFLTSDLFIKSLSILFVIAFANNYNENSNVLIGIIVSNLFILLLLLLEYFCFKFLVQNVSKQGNNNIHANEIFIVKYFFVCTFTISFYFLLLIGLQYLSKMIEKTKFIKYQLFKIVLSITYASLVFLLQILFESHVISTIIFIVYCIMVGVHIVSFYCANIWVVKLL